MHTHIPVLIKHAVGSDAAPSLWLSRYRLKLLKFRLSRERYEHNRAGVVSPQSAKLYPQRTSGHDNK